jgi:NAD(P)-dependent dehydrogenase (short-subunit alcohol dehydrogenase family)
LHAIASFTPAAVVSAAAFVFGTVEEATAEQWDRVFSVNVKGYALCIKGAKT